MLHVSTASFIALCHPCGLRHPCHTEQEFADFCTRHPGHPVSRFDRSWLDLLGSPLAPHRPRSKVVSTSDPAMARHLRLHTHRALAEARPNADLKLAHSADVPIVITLASLASHASNGRESNPVDNATNLYLDAMVILRITLQAGTPANDKAVHMLLYGGFGTDVTSEALAAGDAALAIRNPTNLREFNSIPVVEGGTWYRSNPAMIAHVFGGALPDTWGLVVRNYTGVTFSATEGEHVKGYRGYFATVI